MLRVGGRALLLLIAALVGQGCFHDDVTIADAGQADGAQDANGQDLGQDAIGKDAADAAAPDLLQPTPCTWKPFGSILAEENLRAIWGVAGQVWIGGWAGTMRHIDSSGTVATHTMEKGANHAVLGIWGTSPTEIWAVDSQGDTLKDGRIFKYTGTGTNWPIETTYKDNDLRAIWGRSANDIYVVGSGGLTLHFDGSWNTEVASTTDGPRLNAVWGNADPVWAAGNAGWLAIRENSASGWKPDSASTVAVDLLDIAGGPNTQWAVGGGGTVMKRDSAGWSSIPTPTSINLRGIWGPTETEFWIVGGGGLILYYNNGSWITHRPYNGAIVDDVEVQPGLFAIWGTSRTDIWAVGNKGTVLRCLP